MSALTPNRHTPVDATAGTVAMTLPPGAAGGSRIIVEKVDASANTVTVTGSVRGVAATTLTLAYQYETFEFIADSAGSWHPTANHLPRTAVDSTIGAAITAGTGPTAAALAAAYPTFATTQGMAITSALIYGS